MAPRIAFDGLFRPSPRVNLTPGAWYLGFRCVSCGNPIAIMDDPTNSGVVETGGAGEFEAQCASCGETHTYLARSMVAWQAASGGPAGPA